MYVNVLGASAAYLRFDSPRPAGRPLRRVGSYPRDSAALGRKYDMK